MTSAEFFSLIDSYVPKALSDEYCLKYGAYDNSGLLIGGKGEVKKVLCALDLSMNAIIRAEEIGANVIFTHHPAIYGSISDIRADDLGGEKILRAIRDGISVISAHLNLDCAKEGIDYMLMRGVLLSAGTIPGEYDIVQPLSGKGTGYGRIYSVNEIDFASLVANMKNTFSSERIVSYGENKKIRKMASFCGAGADEKNIIAAKKSGADAVASADFKHHLIAMALELGLNVINLTHYASENYGFKEITKNIIGHTGIPFEYYTDSALL